MSAGDRESEVITVHVPPELPTLSTSVSRILLAILVELTQIEVLDGPAGRGTE